MTANNATTPARSWRLNTRGTTSLVVVSLGCALVGGMLLTGGMLVKEAFTSTYYSHERINTAMSSVPLLDGVSKRVLTDFLSEPDWVITGLSEKTITYFQDGAFHRMALDDNETLDYLAGHQIVGINGTDCPEQATAKQIDQISLDHADEVTALSSGDIQYCAFFEQDIRDSNRHQLATTWNRFEFAVLVESNTFHDHIEQASSFMRHTDPAADKAAR